VSQSCLHSWPWCLMCAQRYQSRIVSISNGLTWGNGSGTRYHLEQMLYRFLARSAPTTGGLCLDNVAVFGAPLQWLIIQSPQGTAKEYQWGLRSVPEMTISSMKPTVSEIDFRKFTRFWYSHRVCPVPDKTATQETTAGSVALGALSRHWLCLWKLLKERMSVLDQ